MTGNVLELDGGAMVSGWTSRGKESEEGEEEDERGVKKEQSKL